MVALGMRFACSWENDVEANVQAFVDKCHRMVAVRRHKLARRDERPPSVPGWTLIGTGHFGEAWVHDEHPDLVLKISGPAGWGGGYRAYVGDIGHTRYDAWPVYARYCMQNPGLHLPKIYHLEQVSRGIAWGVMPRYNDGDTIARDAARRALRGGSHGLAGVRQMRDAMGLSVDVHEGNVMRCPETNDWILTDPFSFQDEDGDDDPWWWDRQTAGTDKDES